MHMVATGGTTIINRLSEGTRMELAGIGIEIIAVDGQTGDLWPALKLPSGVLLVVGRDPEGNGPGVLSEEPAE